MKYAVVLGRSAEVWDELDAAKALIREAVGGVPVTVIATKRAGRDYDGPVHHWPSFHHDMIIPWVAERAKAGRPPAENYWSCRPANRRAPRSPLPIKWIDNIGGSSGMLGVQVALHPEVDIDKVILCGIPMMPSKRYDVNTEWREALAHRDAWNKYLPQMKDRVRSMSGWTQELLGPVTEEWLRCDRS